MSPSDQDPYQLTPEAVKEPPRTPGGILRQVGPGLILAAAVVGSGELVITTVLGAESGYILLWLILLSCAIKVVVQHEIGRYTIGTGETTLEALDRVPGPRMRVSWVIWLWLLMVCSLMFSIGGMLGAIAEVLNRIVPAIPLVYWVPGVSVVTFILLSVGRYGLIEKVSTALVGALTAMTIAGVVLLLKRPDLFAWSDVVDGLKFQLPSGGLSTALTVFGGTGVGAAELATYPYWCIEKGYARFVGPTDGSPAWRKRAHGWINVMSMDVVLSLFVYTFATVAFFLLGAGVLHGFETIPRGAETIRSLSLMYRETLGPWSLPLFLVGAVAVLYSTIFALTAAFSRLTADFLGLAGFYDRTNYALRTRFTQGALAVFLVFPCITFYFIREPVVMVKVSGITQAILLPVIGFSIFYLGRRHLPQSVAPSLFVRLALWATSAVMAVVVAGSLFLEFTR